MKNTGVLFSFRKFKALKLPAGVTLDTSHIFIPVLLGGAGCH